MATRGNKAIDWDVANLDGCIFPDELRLRMRDSLIPIFSTPEPEPAPRPRRRARRTGLAAAGFSGGVALASLCAMAFMHRPAALPAAPVAAAMIAHVELPGPAPALAAPEAPKPAPAAAPEKPAPRKPVMKADLKAAANPPPAPIAAAAPMDEAKVFAGLPLEAAVPARAAEIDRSAASVALAVAARRAAACLEPGDARSSMSASVTFAPSGRATSATVDGGPFAGTEVGGCIARALRSATVGGFEGAPVTIHGTIRVR